MTMEPRPYQITNEDIDEVISAHESVDHNDFSEQELAVMRAHIMDNILEVDEVSSTAPETDFVATDQARIPSEDDGKDPSFARKEAALAAIEDILIRDGYIVVDSDEERVFSH